MILPDSSVWVDHLRRPEPTLQALLDADLIAVHPYVAVEVALGSIGKRHRVLARFRELPQLNVVDLAIVSDLIEGRPLWSRGIGFADAALLVATWQAPDTRLWTRDKSLRRLAGESSIDADLD